MAGKQEPNWIGLGGFALALGGAVVSVTLYVSKLAVHEERISRNEAELRANKQDHDTLVEVRADVKRLILLVEKRNAALD